MKWEYRADAINTIFIETQLNLIGEEGWELVAIYNNNYIFKRPLKSK